MLRCFREGAQCAFCTCRRMFRKGSQSPTRLTFETALETLGTQNADQVSLSQARETPELHRRASMERKIVPDRSPEYSQKTITENSILSLENLLPRGWENIKSQRSFFDPCMCHIDQPTRAQWRPKLADDAHKHPPRPNKSLKKCFGSVFKTCLRL